MLHRLLEGLQTADKNGYGDGQHHQQGLVFESKPTPVVGIGLDSCVIPLRHGGLFLVQSTDFFYPLVDDPYVMGKIACANVLSDVYAMGAVEVDNVLMLLSTSNKMTEKERDTIMPLILQGFKVRGEERSGGDGNSFRSVPKRRVRRFKEVKQ